MTLVKKDAGAPPARRTNGMPIGAYGHGLDPAGTGELAALQWLHERRTGFLTFVTETLELVGGPKVVPWLLLGMLVLLLALRRVIMALTPVQRPGSAGFPVTCQGLVPAGTASGVCHPPTAPTPSSVKSQQEAIGAGTSG